MKIKNLFLPCVALILFSACTHKQIQPSRLSDTQMSCQEIITEYAKTEIVLEDIDDKTGFSGRNVAMGIFFWPGIVVNQMNATDARAAANKRIEVLTMLSDKKQCTIDRKNIDNVKLQLNEDFNKTTNKE